jgi:hypothetical protein
MGPTVAPSKVRTCEGLVRAWRTSSNAMVPERLSSEALPSE